MEKREIYIITVGEYSDYHIDACFLDKEKAERYLEQAKLVNCYDGARLEVYILNEGQEKVVRKYWSSKIDVLTGKITENEETFYEWADQSERGEYTNFEKLGTYIPTELYSNSYISSEHANKLAIEARQNFLRNIGGIEKIKKHEFGYIYLAE